MPLYSNVDAHWRYSTPQPSGFAPADNVHTFLLHQHSFTRSSVLPSHQPEKAFLLQPAFCPLMLLISVAIGCMRCSPSPLLQVLLFIGRFRRWELRASRPAASPSSSIRQLMPRCEVTRCAVSTALYTDCIVSASLRRLRSHLSPQSSYVPLFFPGIESSSSASSSSSNSPASFSCLLNCS